MKMNDSLRAHLARREEALTRVRHMLVERLRVPLPPERIDLDAPLFGTGLALDSVDAVELVVAIETEFSLQFSEGAVGPSAFRTVHSVVELVLDPPEGITRVEPADSPIEEAEAG